MKTAAALFLLLCACDGGSTPADSGPASDSSLPVDAGGDEDAIHLRVTPYVLAPYTEEYRCWFFAPPPATTSAVRALRNVIGPGVHHVGLFGSRSAPSAPIACEEFGVDWTLLGGSGTSEELVEFPEGMGFPLRTTGSYVLQVHLVNPSGSPIEVVAGYDLLLTEPDVPYTRVGVYVTGTTEFEVPPRTSDHVVGTTCSGDLPVGAELLRLFPHMHSLGTRFEAELSDGTGARSIYDSRWLFDDQNIIALDRGLVMSATDELTVRCHFDNPSDTAVPFGLHTTDEMCFGVWYFAPAETDQVYCVE